MNYVPDIPTQSSFPLGNPNRRRLVLTSVNQLISTVQNNPKLKEALPQFSQIIQMTPSTAPKKGCNCGSKFNFVTPDGNKQTAENILSSLTAEDFKKIKEVLNLDELCYYKRNTENNTLSLHCL